MWPSTSRPVTVTKRPMSAIAKVRGIPPTVGRSLTVVTGNMIT